ncbi:MAG TPA: ATP-binding protein [Candidatus Acidoferrales bacterium]|nr:ATP-binding protein [Candidatus Acidoferrales bacterium]
MQSKPIYDGADGPGVFLGREAESARLRAAIERRESLAIWGPADAGKTALVRHAIAGLPREIARQCVYLPVRAAPRQMLRRLLEDMHAAGDEFLAGKFRGETGRGASFAQWAKRQTSLRMRGLFYRAAQEGKYRVFLDDVAGFSDAFARIVKELTWMRETPVYLIARGCGETELGRAARLYWNDDLRLPVGPIAVPAARALVEHCIRRFGLSRLNLDGFREGILRLSERLPGAIVKMCARAVDTEYYFGGRVETRLLHVDYMMQFSYRGRRGASPAGGTRGASLCGPGGEKDGEKSGWK